MLLSPSLAHQHPNPLSSMETFSSASLQTKKLYLWCPAFHKSQLDLSEDPQNSMLPSFSLLSHKEALKKHIFQFFPAKGCNLIRDWGLDFFCHRILGNGVGQWFGHK